MIDLPSTCPKGMTDVCSPLSQIMSDCEETFVCCGVVEDGVNEWNDKFRVCFRSVDTDSEYLLNHQDMIDQVSVMSMAMSIEARLKDDTETNEEKK